MQIHFQMFLDLLCTCAPGRLGSLRVFLVIVGLQDVPVLGHHEDRDEIDNSKRQKLSLLTVLLEQTKPTKQPVSSAESSNRGGILMVVMDTVLLHECVSCTTHDISEDDSPEAVYVHVLKEPVKVSDWRHPTCHCINRTLQACMEITPSPHALLHQSGCLLIHVHFMEQGKVSQLREAVPPGIMSLT